MEYKYEYICQMKQPVLCELCNKSYALGVMKKLLFNMVMNIS